MVLMTALAMAMAAPDAITLGEALALPPAKAGDRIIGDHPHGEIIAIEPLPTHGMDPPGMSKVMFVEPGRETSDGCVRQLWIAIFIQGPGQSREAAKASTVYPQQQVAQKPARGCSTASYVKTDPGLPARLALSALATLKSPLVLRRASTAICRDDTRSLLCTSDSVLRSELRTLSPWMITTRNGPVELWLGIPGQVITIVTLSNATGKIASIRREIPAPF
ncbi:hypothetical protein [Blastomonas sp.]|uniref:hypothetical protein n=1 Tax=Blastomonas sp. TaxID=1909299 RepID=UPI00406A976B